MEHVLKLEEFVPLREVQNNPLSLCPTKPDSFQLVQTMIDQILTLHQGHIKVSNYRVQIRIFWISKQLFCKHTKALEMYSINKIRKTQNEHMIIVCQNLIGL